MAARTEYMGALDLFFQHAQHAIQLQLGVIGATATLLGIAGAALGDRMGTSATAAGMVLAGCLLMSMPWVSRSAVAVLTAHYRLYLYALVFAAELQEMGGLPVHGWLTRMLPSDAAPPLADDVRRELVGRYLEEPVENGRRSSYSSYRQLVLGLGYLSASLGLCLFAGGIVSLVG